MSRHGCLRARGGSGRVPAKIILAGVVTIGCGSDCVGTERRTGSCARCNGGGGSGRLRADSLGRACHLGQAAGGSCVCYRCRDEGGTHGSGSAGLDNRSQAAGEARVGRADSEVSDRGLAWRAGVGQTGRAEKSTGVSAGRRAERGIGVGAGRGLRRRIGAGMGRWTRRGRRLRWPRRPGRCEFAARTRLGVGVHEPSRRRQAVWRRESARLGLGERLEWAGGSGKAGSPDPRPRPGRPGRRGSPGAGAPGAAPRK